MSFEDSGFSLPGLHGLTLGLQGLSTSLGIGGAFQRGSADEANAIIKYTGDERAAEARAETDAFNAKVARQLADSTEQQGKANAADYRRTQGAKAASAVAIRAASGLALEGSPLMVGREIFEEIDFGSSRIGFAARQSATRLRNQGTLLDVSAENNRRTAEFAKKARDISVSNIRKATRYNAAAAGVRGAATMFDTLSTRGASGWGPKTPKVSNQGWDESGFEIAYGE